MGRHQLVIQEPMEPEVRQHLGREVGQEQEAEDDEDDACRQGEEGVRVEAEAGRRLHHALSRDPHGHHAVPRSLLRRHEPGIVCQP